MSQYGETHYRGLKEMTAAFRDRHQRTGVSVGRLFDDLLTFILHGFCIDAKPLGKSAWPYDEEGNRWFQEMTCILVSSAQDPVDVPVGDGFLHFHDLLGELYMSLASSKSDRQFFAQYFTPENVVRCLQLIASPVSGDSICDPSCGSGRMLLVRSEDSEDTLCFGNDLDQVCVKMTACNLLLHGRRGLVTRGDALSNEYYGGYAVNLPTGDPVIDILPHAVTLTAEQARSVWVKESKYEEL